jgi:hypothetical protein
VREYQRRDPYSLKSSDHGSDHAIAVDCPAVEVVRVVIDRRDSVSSDATLLHMQLILEGIGRRDR